MKRLFALFIILSAFTSCSISDDSPNYYYEIMPVESVSMPESFTVGNIYEISMTYLRPNSCYVFNDIYYSYDDQTTRTVAVICTVYDGTGTTNSCEELDYPEYDVSFNFQPMTVGTYTFKFWQGEDASGEDEFLVVQVEVTN